MKYIISTDSTADLPESYVKEHGIAVQFLSYAFGDTVYGANNQIEPHAFYEQMRSGECRPPMPAFRTRYSKASNPT